ncbi:hypothetical protein BUALT_Bualt02G0098800 [Buddleja alternifolia]|uniref:Inositol polyphosphate multikinase n=1 Tax=Buddleja alternifolia TaxID=168488 RepID=A0AAV6Y9M7_9LAMI|nr:hypothetical protein BUALT_Bualt02G0098800 [Buddleja alternifolia]
MLKVPDHQVAGHKAGNGNLGPLIDDLGRFYKPLQGNERGSTEVAFYTSFSSNKRVPEKIRRFFPKFYGTQLIKASDGSGMQPHLVLQDFNFGRVNPSVMDIKIGSRTWAPQSPEEYIEKCLRKDRASTSLSLGFRLSGLQIYESKESGFFKPYKRWVKSLSADEVKLLLKKFVCKKISDALDVKCDCDFALAVYGGPTGILSQLLELKSWFEDQTIYHFYSCSILMMFEKELASNGKNPRAEIKLIDFAHVYEGSGIIDHNFLGGLCSMIKFIYEILTTSEDRPSDVYVEDFQKNQISFANGDGDNLFDTCPSEMDTTRRNAIFINGYPCKNPSNITASDFKSSLLNESGDTDNFYRSSMTMATALEFPGLNTLGLSTARTDIEVDGMVMPHAHPRASEMIFVRAGLLVAGFVDSNNQVFQKRLKEGDVFVFPKGLLHFCYNAGFENAIVFSVLNSQNPGLASITGAMFVSDGLDAKEMVMKKLKISGISV